MTDRVGRHQEERKGRGWDTYECPVDLVNAFKVQAKEYDVILLDCLTLWVNNILFSYEQDEKVLTDFIIKEKADEWLDALSSINSTVVCVTNEVGLGIVPDNSIARRYRDLVGTVNQTIGKRADELALVACGIPLYLKK